jgi:transcriptional regulator with XRE-family HTH domain
MTTANENSWKVLVLMLKHIAEDKGITQEQIAEATGLQQSNISRLFSIRYCPTLQTFLAIATAIGVNFFFEDKESKTELNVMLERAMTEIGRRTDKLPKN